MLIEASLTWSFWPNEDVLCCIISLLFCLQVQVTERLWVFFFFSTISQICHTLRCGNAGLSGQHSCFAVYAFHVHVWVIGGDEGVRICVCQVSVCNQVPACVCIRTSPHSRGSASVAVAARTCAWFRLQLAHLCKSADTISSLSQPTFPTKHFPTIFFPPPCLCHACGDAKVTTDSGVEERWIT